MQEVFDLLNRLSIEYKIFKHKAVFTCDDAKKLNLESLGIGCKNLFLKGKRSYYLIVLEDKKRINFKYLKDAFNDNNLSFASNDELKSVMNVFPGSVSPLGIINDEENVVKIVFDDDLVGEMLLIHPNTNTSTLLISYFDLIEVVKYLNHSYMNIKMKKET